MGYSKEGIQRDERKENQGKRVENGGDGDTDNNHDDNKRRTYFLHFHRSSLKVLHTPTS